MIKHAESFEKLPRVLLIDDDPVLLRAVRNLLMRTGRYEVDILQDPTHLFEKLDNFFPDAIVLDILMPEKDGGSVVADLREDSRYQGIPVIFLSSILRKEEAKSLGGRIQDYPILAKPVTRDELVTALEDILSEHASAF